MSAFYPGAGTDITPPILFRNIKNWIYMDSQPKSRVSFISKLLMIMLQNEFELKAVDSDTYTFYNRSHDQTIRYETNTDDLRTSRECKTLVLIGYSLTNMPSNFISSYTHIITDSISLSDQSELLFKNVSVLFVDKTLESSEYTTKNILKYVGIVNPRYKS